MGTTPMRALTVPLLLLSLLGAACRGSSSTGTLTGQFRASGGLTGAGGFNTPTAGTIQVRDSTGRLIASVHMDSSGEFSTRLPPGAYVLMGITPMHVGGPCGIAHAVVRQGAVVHVELLCVLP
jgi:hypothetical protein